MEQLLAQILEAIMELKKDEDLVYTTEELTDKLKTYPEKINQLRRCGALEAIKKGSGYIFTKRSVDRFLDLFDGTDISNDAQIMATMKEKRIALARQSHS